MKRYIVLTLVSVCLLSIVVGPSLAQMGSRGRASDMMEQGKMMRDGQGMHGMGFMHSAGNAYGEYVTFTIDNKTGNITNYGIMGTQLFNISIANFNYKSTSSQGSITSVSNIDGSILIKLHDNPAAVINILTTKNISVTFTLADGVTAAKEDNFVRITSGGIEGYIVGGNITSSVSGAQVKVDASPNSAVVFRAAPVNMPMFNQIHRRFSQEIARNRVGLEVALGRNGTYSAVNYSAGVQLMVQEMQRDRIRLQINATEQAGRIIAIDLDNSALVIGAGDRLRIRYDGQLLQCVDDPNMVFNDTDRPVCWISPIQDRVRAQLVIHVPSYSEHIVEILVEPEVTGTPTVSPTANVTATPMVTTPRAPGFGLIFSLAGLLIWAFLYKWRKN